MNCLKTNNLTVYELNDNTVNSEPFRYPAARHSSCMTYAQGFIYVFGGCTTHSTAFNDLWRFLVLFLPFKSSKNKKYTTFIFYRLDLSNAKWSRLSSTGSNLENLRLTF